MKKRMKLNFIRSDLIGERRFYSGSEAFCEIPK